MRAALLIIALALSACAAPGARSASGLIPADAATRLIAGERVALSTSSRAGGGGQDPLVLIELRFADGRVLSFEEANHTPQDNAAQAAGGPLAQVMGLDETSVATLYRARDVSRAGALCAPTGPRLLGVHTGADGRIAMVGLKEEFGFETRADGGYAALPVGPAIVCARLAFQPG